MSFSEQALQSIYLRTRKHIRPPNIDDNRKEKEKKRKVTGNFH